MIFDMNTAAQVSDDERAFLSTVADRLNRKKFTLEARGWRGEAVYQWLCMICGRYLRRFRPTSPTDPPWQVKGWAIGRGFNGPKIYFDITQDRVRVDARDGHKAWTRQNRL